MRPDSEYSVRRGANHSRRRLAAILKAACFAAAILAGVTTEAQGQTALSFVTSQGVPVYDLTYVNSVDCIPHLFPGTPTVLPSVPLGVVVFSATFDDPTLMGQSFENVFGVSESAIVEQLKDGTSMSSLDPAFLSKICNNYVINDPNTGNPADIVTADGYRFSNGQDIGTIAFDPPITIGVFGLAAENAVVPEPGPVAAAIATGLTGLTVLWPSLAIRRRRKSAGR